MIYKYRLKSISICVVFSIIKSDLIKCNVALKCLKWLKAHKPPKIQLFLVLSCIENVTEADG